MKSQFRRQKDLFYGICLGFVLILAGCSSRRPVMKELSLQADKRERHYDLLSQSLRDRVAFLKNSELSVHFPERIGESLSQFILEIRGEDEIYLSGKLPQKEMGRVKLARSDFDSLYEDIKNLNLTEFESEKIRRCDVYVISIRVQDQLQHFAGCRKKSPNTAVVSRLAQKTQFLLLKNGKKIR